MPTVPDFRIPTETQSAPPMPYRSAHAPALAFGPGGEGADMLGQGLGRAGNRAGTIARQMMDEENETAIKTADDADSEWYRQQRADENGFWNKQGMDAWNARDAYRQDLRTRIDRNAAGLANDLQRRTYLKIADARAGRVLDQAFDYAAGQRDAAIEQASLIRRKNAIADGAAQWRDRAALAQFHAAGRAEIAETARRKGWGQEQDLAALKEYDTAFFAEAVRQAAAEDPMAARALLGTHGGLLSARDHAGLSALVATREKAFLAGLDVKLILAEEGGDAPPSRESALDGVPADRRDAVVAGLARADRQADQARQAQRQEDESVIADWVLKQDRDPAELPPAILERLSPSMLEGWSRYAATRMDGREDDPAERDRLTVMAALDPKGFLAEDPTAWNLSPATVAALIGRKGAILSGDAGEAERSALLKRGLAVSGGLVADAGLMAGSERMADFTARLAERIDAFSAEAKRPPSDADMLSMARDLTMPGRLRGGGGQARENASVSARGEDPSVLFADIPETDRLQMAAWLDGNGARADDKTVEALYAAWKRGDRAAAARAMQKGNLR